MQPNPLYRIGVREVRELLTRAPWMQLASHPASGPIASPSPVLLAPEDGGGDHDPIVLETHLGRADARLHGLLKAFDPARERRPARPSEQAARHSAPTMLVIAQGEHGYISPSWYVGRDAGQIPTWNFEMATLTCDVEVLGAQENLETLRRLVAHFEDAYAPEDGVRLDIDDDGNLGMAMGTVGLRLTVRSYDAKSKMSQNKSAETRASVLAHLDASNPGLAERMREADGAEPEGRAPADDAEPAGRAPADDAEPEGRALADDTEPAGQAPAVGMSAGDTRTRTRES